MGLKDRLMEDMVDRKRKEMAITASGCTQRSEGYWYDRMLSVEQTALRIADTDKSDWMVRYAVLDELEKAMIEVIEKHTEGED